MRAPFIITVENGVVITARQVTIGTEQQEFHFSSGYLRLDNPDLEPIGINGGGAYLQSNDKKISVNLVYIDIHD